MQQQTNTKTKLELTTDTRLQTFSVELPELVVGVQSFPGWDVLRRRLLDELVALEPLLGEDLQLLRASVEAVHLHHLEQTLRCDLRPALLYDAAVEDGVDPRVLLFVDRSSHLTPPTLHS